ncbi:MAG: hypothetical protein KY468_03170 [Armatimonadetes bacterium]|nr:hypothetical protein [Armatimonadota bacterium]
MTLSEVPRYPVTIDGESAEIGTAAELATALDVLHGQNDRAVLEQLRPHLAEILVGPAGFLAAMKVISPDDQVYLIRAVGPRLPELLGEARHLRDLLATLAHLEVEEALLETLGSDGLRSLVATAEELSEVLEWLYGECDRRALELLGDDCLRRLVHDGAELSLLLHSLDAGGQENLLRRVGWETVIRCIHDGRDLAYVLRALPPDYSNELLDRYSREELAKIIGNRADWAYLCRRLDDREAAQLYLKLGVTCDAV